MTTHILDSMIAFTMKLIFFKDITFLKEKGRDESKPFFFFYLVFTFSEDSESFQTRLSCVR